MEGLNKNAFVLKLKEKKKKESLCASMNKLVFEG